MPTGNQGCQKRTSSTKDTQAETTATVGQIITKPVTPITPRPANTNPKAVSTTRIIPTHWMAEAFKPNLGSNQLRSDAVKNAPGFTLGSSGLGAAASPAWANP